MGQISEGTNSRMCGRCERKGNVEASDGDEGRGGITKGIDERQNGEESGGKAMFSRRGEGENEEEEWVVGGTGNGRMT